MRFCSLMSAFVLLAGSASASAATIGFNNLSGSNASVFSTYTESGYTVAAASGDPRVAQNFGNATPDVYFSFTNGSTSGSISVTLGGSAFMFSAVDLANANTSASANASYTLTGYLGAMQAFTQSGNIFGGTAAFVTVSSTQPTLLIDRLVIAEANVSGATSANVDNIVVNAATTVTPEPTSMLLLGTGILGIVGVARKRVIL